MEAVVRFSLKQKVLYNLMFVFLIVAGAFAMFSLPAERYPNVNFGEVTVSTFYPGADPVEVETLVTREIETALESVEDIEWITSTSYRQYSNVRLKFFDDKDYDALYNEVRFKVLNIIGELPEGIDPPSINASKVEDFLPVIVVNLAGDHENRALSLMAREMKAFLQKIQGVKEVQLQGEYVREFHVFLDPGKMTALGITFDEVVSSLQQANVSIPAGDYNSGDSQFVVKVDEKFRSRAQVVDTILRADADGSFVRLNDVISNAGPGYRDPGIISSINGKDALALKVIKSASGNALNIKDDVLAIVEQFRAGLKQQGVDLVLTQDSTIHIEDALNTLGLNLLLGIILVSLIIWYFMGIRNAGLITIGIPFAFMITMTLMYLTGNSLNEITLFAFVLVTGIVVDDAIVVTENIYRHMQEGASFVDSIVRGTAEVALPVISATTTTVAAFLPMLIMTGPTGEFFSQIPKAVSFAILASLVECLMILPIHYLDFGPRPDNSGKNDLLDHDNALLKVFRNFTDKLLIITMRHRIKSILLVAAAFIISMVILGLSVTGKVPLIKIKFFPDDYTLYYVDVEGPTGTPIEKVDSLVKEISEYIQADGPTMARSASGFAGFYPNDDYEPVFGSNRGTVMVALPAKQEQGFDDPLEHLDSIRNRLKPRFEKNGFQLRIHAQKDGPPTGKDINVRVLGTDTDTISVLADKLFTFMQSNPGIGPYLSELGDDRGKPKKVFRFNINHERVSEYNLDSSRVARLAASVLDGRYVGKYRLSDEEVDLKVLIDPAFIKQPEDSLYIPLVEHASGPIRLGDLTTASHTLEPGDLNRYQYQRAISIKANIKAGAPTSTPAIVRAVREYYESLRQQYPGATVIFGGEHENTRRSYTSLAYAFIISIMIMYVILATQFQSYLQPLIILSAIVFALIGVIFGKVFSQTLFTVNSFIAVIGVAGVVVNDALVLIDFINKRYRAGMSRHDAIEAGVRIRLRPILLTTLTTTLGLLPMAIGIPYYSHVWGAMAQTFVTGLATATTLTLFVVPVLWDLLQGYQERRNGIMNSSETRTRPQMDANKTE